MGFYTGSNGQLLLAPRESVPNATTGVLEDANGNTVEKVIAKVRSWSFTSSTATLDVTTLGDTDRIFREGIRSASGNASIFYYTNNENGTVSNLSELMEYQLGDRDVVGAGGASDDQPAKFSLKFLMGRGTQNPYYLIGRCAITSFTLTMGVGEISSANVAFDINGALVKYRI